MPSLSWHGVTSSAIACSIHGTSGCTSCDWLDSPHTSPPVVVPNTRHEPSASRTYAGPPESPLHVPMPPAPANAYNPSTASSGTVTERLGPSCEPSFATP